MEYNPTHARERIIATSYYGASLKALEMLGRRKGYSLERTARKSGHLCPYGGTEVSMAGSYSADLRGRVLAAVEAGAPPRAAGRRVPGGPPPPPPLGRGGPRGGGRVAQRAGGGPQPPGNR